MYVFFDKLLFVVHKRNVARKSFVNLQTENVRSESHLAFVDNNSFDKIHFALCITGQTNTKFSMEGLFGEYKLCI